MAIKTTFEFAYRKAEIEKERNAVTVFIPGMVHNPRLERMCEAFQRDIMADGMSRENAEKIIFSM